MSYRDMRVFNNLLAILIVVCAWVLMILLGGCTIYKVHSVPGESAKVSIYSTRSFTAPELAYQRQGDNATFSFGADSATQPGPGDWSNAVGSLLLNMNAYCKAYPVMCTGSRDAPEYTPEIIRRAEVYCRAYPAMCNE